MGNKQGKTRGFQPAPGAVPPPGESVAASAAASAEEENGMHTEEDDLDLSVELGMDHGKRVDIDDFDLLKVCEIYYT